MYLKKIQIQGFKSFPNKTTIEFIDGITGIVGPNGSGKSNISDAIRWALGEQSTKMLRGSKMEDVIFAGSESRKPLGFAEVILVFDNSDGAIDLEYNEVAIKRRVFRSGESEYSINNTSCRLRDVRDIFMDTGIGKDGYSIVGQGKIDEILSNKPEERRHIFEEAAGIIKYKVRKEEAERKLKRTDENILRVNDILRELDGRHDYLLNESRKAEKYKEIKAELVGMELDLLLRKISRLDEKTSLLNKEQKAIVENKSRLEEKIRLLTRDIESREEDVAGIDLRLDELDKVYTDTNKDLLELNNRKTIQEESKRYSLLENDRLEKEIQQDRETIKNNMQENEEQLKEKLDLERKLEDLKDTHIKEESLLKESLQGLNKEEEVIEKIKEEMISSYNAITDKKGELSNLTNFKKTILNQSSDIEFELEKIKEEKENIEKDRKLLEIKLEKELEKERDNTEILARTVDSINSLEEERLASKNKLEKINIDLNMNRSQYNMNMNMQENYEGYYKSVKALMVNSKKDSSLQKNIVGVIADLISVDEAYTKAIDIALGSNIQNIVTPNEVAAKELIGYLKKNKLGRATFLPLNIIRGRRFNLDSIDYDEFGIVGLGSDIIDYDPKYKNVIESLLGRVVITKDMDSSIKLARKLNHATRIVSLDGDLINPGGSMTGGSVYSKSTNILNRKNVLKDLEDERIKLSESYSENKSRLEDLDNLYDEKIKIRLDLEEDIKLSTSNSYRLKNEIEGLVSNYQRIEERSKKLDEDYLYFNKENESMDKKRRGLELEIERMEEENKFLKDKIATLTEGLKSRKLEKDDLVDRITKLKIKINSLEGEYKYKNESLESISSRNMILEKGISSKKKELEDNKEKILELSNNIGEIDKEIVKVMEKNNLLETEKKELQEKRKNLSRILKDLKDRDQEYFKELERIKQRLNELNLDLTRKNVHYENYVAEVVEGFNIEYTEGMKGDFPHIEYSDLDRLIGKNKKEIENLGVVNLGTIDEYAGVKERLDFMNSQINDLNRAKDDLFKIIKELEDKMEVKFMASFKEIRKNFNEVFKILFDGGKADLILEDDGSILECGIEIKAQPPGKKFQSLSLLSGGERSLTAVALLFSILEMKPAPFCILDEIDAALDESNIDRYTSYLKRFSHATQFIMITHRKRTMEIADSIYGVTMEEKGVSKTISMELSDLESKEEV